MKSNNFDELLDQAVTEIRNEPVDSTVVDEAAGRVWARLAVETAAQTNTTAPAIERIGDCEDFQSLIPAYLIGSLSEARSLLLVDHTHECIPCRKAMNAARARRLGPAKKATVARRYSLQPVVLRWGIAAALVIGVGLIALPFIQRWSPLGGDLEATVQAAEGQVFQIADTRSTPVASGQKLQKGERIRTAKDAHAFVRLGGWLCDRNEGSFGVFAYQKFAGHHDSFEPGRDRRGSCEAKQATTVRRYWRLARVGYRNSVFR